ncbi:putative E3 ubiquitin-protein ligase PUB23 [Iris pallida]|uniref:U-box domain-containing protein n=1 Tax=Iris pallida TaxID=29817 RepID=A0AAX6E008_IRIPA|nr:putative E3 ubiquitin-protein ligase PUB23 [Iris pallida]
MMNDHEIPPYFICPISLQIMKDPVILSSGVSYDRSSIDRWLSAYQHRSCPVTNQPLADRTLTPNTTLLNLINSWAAAPANPNPPVVSKTPPAFFDPSDIVRELTEATSSNDPCFQMKSLDKIASSIRAEPGRTACMEEAGITSYVASLITSFGSSSSDLVNKATTVLSLLDPSAEALKQAAEQEKGGLVETLISVMQRGSCGARIHAALLLRSIFRSVADAYKKDLPPDLFDCLVETLKDQNSNRKATMAALLILAEVLPYGRNRARAVEAGVAAVVVELLVEESRDERRAYCEAMLWVLELLCRKAEGRAPLAAHPAGVAAVAGKVLRVSAGATERAVKVLALVCGNVRGGPVVEEMMAVGGVAKLCMVVQVEGSRKVREMAKGVLGLHMKTWSKSPCFLSYCMG